jgi:predicted dehydrogenase
MEVVAYADVVKGKAEKFLSDFGGEYATEDPDKIFAVIALMAF